ncbi:prephenate dehydrogenase [Bradyrhizobium canariense]|uniref:Prephenate dehydrogenase n=1 Tax=Bradyrhizobium canariense TaxID=255045 RepID=A0A1H1XBY3_9BRAD|nr:prephenate dehydrogenase [Bradyrhizobium canariense]SDT06216.1 prephenate dehydrogenase [Bradyrhizobium canariense]
MSNDSNINSRPLIGIIGFGAFGRLTARHLLPHFRLYAYDPALRPGPCVEMLDVMLTDLRSAASCPIIILAVPVNRFEESVAAISPHLKPGSLVLDVGSVKMIPAEIMRRGLPEHVAIIATHPLFGPQSARDGINGLKIAICPIRGDRGRRVAAFLRKALGLNVVMTTPEAHDQDTAMAQGLTHLIAKVLVQMEPFPARMTTKSFDLLVQAIAMVRDDAPEVFQAIERSNPYSQRVRRRFFDLASALDAELGNRSPVRLSADRSSVKFDTSQTKQTD